MFYRGEALDVDGIEAKGPAPYVKLKFRHGCVVERAFERLIRSWRRSIGIAVEYPRFSHVGYVIIRDGVRYVPLTPDT